MLAGMRAQPPSGAAAGAMAAGAQGTSNFRATSCFLGDQLGRDVYRGYKCIGNGYCSCLNAKLACRRSSTNLLLGT
jgi:hypothetical protein